MTRMKDAVELTRGCCATPSAAGAERWDLGKMLQLLGAQENLLFFLIFIFFSLLGKKSLQKRKKYVIRT